MSGTVVVKTSSIAILSSDHGRMRRAQRLISKRDLQAAVKYGTKEPGMPTRSGQSTWRYTFAGIVYITDATSGMEITSWPVPGSGLDVELAEITKAMQRSHDEACKRIRSDASWWTSHTVVVVDQSGSMRTPDVSGGATRSDAVWLTLALDFVAKQIEDGHTTSSDVFTIVGMNETSKVLLDRQPADWILVNNIIGLLRTSEPLMGGNYIPALDAAENLLRSNPSGSCALMLLFLSDGRPSDHASLKWKGWHWSHASAQAHNKQLACERVDALASRFGRRLTVCTIGFGNSGEDFHVLKVMAERSKDFGSRGHFQAPSLTPESLGLAFSSLTTSVSTTKTELTYMVGSFQRNVRDVRREARNCCSDDSNLSHEWEFYPIYCVSRVQWSGTPKRWVPIPLVTSGAKGVALRTTYFGEGAERVVRQFREVGKDGSSFEGPRFVAKESRFIEDFNNNTDLRKFHKIFCHTQLRAQGLAEIFNDRLSKLPGVTSKTPRISFLDCSVYMLNKAPLKIGVLVEKMLDPTKYTKWNNNSGYVKGMSEVALSKTTPTLIALDAIVEESSGDESDQEIKGQPAWSHKISIKDEDIPQAFSHFTFIYTKRTMLVCDLQGVLTSTSSPPLFELTDPVIHCRSEDGAKNVFGRTDLGEKGIHSFFATHKCSDLCRMLDRSWVKRVGVQRA